ncbi:MAG: hypothetical protein H7X77_02740 [Anaerolineae bacterium]|nr:hypothetical protein [Anaerolineae bacterium]
MTSPDRIDRLMDAIELVKTDQREEARTLLRELIREDSNFEEAWLWMSLAVDSLDQSSVCLDNVLRVNPGNMRAAGALYRLRESELEMEKRRDHYRFYRDLANGLLWLLALGLLFAVTVTYMNIYG